jgi:mannose-6-phosphate isomerase-like protein (cupin superfamily)
MERPLNLDEALHRFDTTWEPRVVTRANDYDVRIVRVDGDHAWHVHNETDEFFFCLDGQFTIKMREMTVVFEPGDVYTVPLGVEHCPRAAQGTRILMFEPQGPPTTGDDHGDIGHLKTTHGIEL